MNADYAKKEYRTVGITVFVISIVLLVMRIASYYMQVAMMDINMEQYWLELIMDAIFSVPVQIGLLLIFPMLMYKIRLNKSFKEVLAFSGFRKCNKWVILLSVLVGLFIIFVTMGVSYIWQFIIILFGYTPNSASATMPEQFNLDYFALTVVLTAVLPAICEEFTNRGGLLTVLRMTKSKTMTIVLVGIAFGLFHQYIAQTIYAALLGALLAYLVLETGSIYPAMVVHFMNNFMSLYLDNAYTYGWPIGYNVFDYITEQLSNLSFGNLTAYLAFAMLIVFGLVVAIVAISRKTRKNDFYLELNDNYKKSEVVLERKDNAFYIGAIVVTAISTFTTYIFGL